MSSDGPNPPWYATLPDGEISYGIIPDRLSSHPALQERGITLNMPLKPGVVFRTALTQSPVYVVKILHLDREELPIYERLLRESKRPNNHTAPCEVIRTGHPLLIMPDLNNAHLVHRASGSPRLVIDVLHQLVEGMEFLHSLHIVHFDMCPANVMAALPRGAAADSRLVANRLYIIDFDSSKQFALGPGVQHAVALPPSQIQPPNGLQHFDPYSWDMYCLGRTLESLLRTQANMNEEPPFRIAERFVQWLIGDERGCTGVCHCRPTARTALRVLVVLRWAAYMTEGYRWVASALSCLWTPRAKDARSSD